MADFKTKALTWERAIRWAIDDKEMFGKSLLCEEGAETRYRITPTSDGAYSVDWEWTTPFSGKALAIGSVRCTARTIPAAAASITAEIVSAERASR